ncbi:MAG: RHS repeat-associated core domain-containing protein [Myxococcales bacterium]|nr:RHS repeat-associated core domain-containing protein [Myxococcales bacterium]
MVFVAAPFEAPATPFDPAASLATRYGTTTVYDRRGRAIRSVEANGYFPTATQTFASSQVYVSEVAVSYMSGNAIVASWGPEEHDPTSSRYQHRDQRILTAIGRELQRTRRSASWAILDKVEQDWDLLGRVIATRRYATPTSTTPSTVWTTHYDSLGQVLSMQEPGASAVDTTYDEDGNALETSWMDGSRRRVARTSYDGLGRVTKRDLASILSGVETLESRDIYHYDTHSGASEQPAQAATLLRGRLSWIENPSAGNVYFGYDPLGRGTTEVYKYAGLTGVTSQTSALSAGGVPITLTLKTPQTTDTLTYDYDSAWRNTTIKAGTSTLFNASAITTLGEYRTVVFGNGVSENYTYAATGRREPLTTTIMTASGAYMFENRARDAAGRVVTEAHSTPTGSTTFTTSYDSLGRLQNRVQMSGIMPGIEGFTYDGLGNLATRTSTTGSGDRVYTTDATDPDRLCRFATPGTSLGTVCDFTYDGAGNVATDKTNGQTRTFTYDAGQRITKITRGQQTVNLAYGPLGRLKTTVYGTNARTVWNLGGLIERRTRADGVVQLERMIPGPLGVFVSLRTTLNASGTPAATETIYRHGDGRANRFFTKASGHAVQQATYAAFGTKTSDTGTQGITYTDDLWNGGDDLPEVGVTLLGPRAYDPAVGRFLQRDPIAVMARSTTANPYAFSFNDPVNYSDPSGLCAESPIAVVCAFDKALAIGAGASLVGFMFDNSSGSAHPQGTATGASQMHVAGGIAMPNSTSVVATAGRLWGRYNAAQLKEFVAIRAANARLELSALSCGFTGGCMPLADVLANVKPPNPDWTAEVRETVDELQNCAGADDCADNAGRVSAHVGAKISTAYALAVAGPASEIPKAATPGGVARIRYYQPQNGGGMHFTVEVEIGGESLTTHMTSNLAETETRVVATGTGKIKGFGDPIGKPVEFALPNPAAARAMQLDQMAYGPMGPLQRTGALSHSCTTHICGVLRAGGVRGVPGLPAEARNFLKRMFGLR